MPISAAGSHGAAAGSDATGSDSGGRSTNSTIGRSSVWDQRFSGEDFNPKGYDKGKGKGKSPHAHLPDSRWEGQGSQYASGPPQHYGGKGRETPDRYAKARGASPQRHGWSRG